MILVSALLTSWATVTLSTLTSDGVLFLKCVQKFFDAPPSGGELHFLPVSVGYT